MNNFVFKPSLPPSWGQLHKLTDLILSGCQFSSPKEIGGLFSLISVIMLPAPVGPLPNAVCNWTSIERITISPGLTGNLPSCINRWTKVRFMNLQTNNLTGLLPQVLGSLSTLDYLNLDDNQYYGSIPANFSGLQSCTYLSIRNNHLSGPLPKELGLLTNLPALYLAHNKIWGNIPPEIGNMTSLFLLDISFNYLSGELPDSIGRMQNLITLQLSNNNLYGTLPLSLGSTSRLFDLLLDLNRFWGSIPVSVVNNVSNINLNNNYFSGCLPYDRIAFERPIHQDTVLFVANNRLTGGVPIYLMTRFFVDLSNNRLSVSRAIGTVPTSYHDGIFQLNLSHNDLSGPVPSWLFTGRSRLSFLDLSYNKFSGQVPDGLFSLPQIVSLDVSSNQLTSHLPLNPFSFVAKDVYQDGRNLNLSHNSIEGGISASFFAGVSDYIATLDLSHNKLSGTLQGITNLTAKSIQYLDFSSNDLTGSIPTYMTTLINLEHLDLSDNNLSGSLPVFEISGLTYVNFSGNPLLTGAR